ncbi:MAG: hypothetical protein HZB13_03915 [Acidobacteria bacterium]|nr:hypothetical protein [Acidobacteriota bacterium]
MTFWLAGCAPDHGSAPATPVKKSAPPRPSDETRSFPATNRVDAKVVEGHLLDHDFLPGGNIAHYKQGQREYDLILIRTSSPTAAALLLLDYQKKLEKPELVAHFGGYFGKDGGRDAFIFTKGEMLCGVLGLKLAEADPVGRELAARVR